MNGKDFMTKSTYNTLVQKILDNESFSYRKEIKAEYGKYEFHINFRDRYCLDEYGWESGWLDKKYRNPALYDGWSITGGHVTFYGGDVKSYEDFVQELNRSLDYVPDFSEDEEEQLSLF
jgi:hypothetical protein